MSYDSVVADCDAIDWLSASASAAPKFEIAPDVMRNTPLFNNLPNDDKSLESIRLTSSPTATATVTSPTTQHIPTIHLISPPRPVQSVPISSSGTVAEDLTEDGEQAITSLASRMTILENSIGSIANSLSAIASQQINSARFNPPASHEGAVETP